VAVTYTAQAATDGALLTNKVAYERMLVALEDGLSLLNHPAIVMAEDVNGPDWYVGLTPAGTLTILIDMVTPLFASTAETTDVAGATTIDLGAATMSVGEYDLVFGTSNELRRRDPIAEGESPYQLDRVAQRVLRSASLTVTNGIVALAPSASTTVGTTGTPPVWDMISEAAGAIMIASKGTAAAVVCILHPRQWELIRRDLEASDGARAERREFDRFQDPAATGYQGMIGIIEVWTCDRVSESGGDYSGLMFAAGGVGLAIVPPGTASADQTVAIDTPLCRVTEAYNPDDKSTRLIGELTFGASILRQELVREILSTGV
jgi:hypothetical protein